MMRNDTEWSKIMAARARRYLINVIGCVEPQVFGPFESEKTRNCEARKVNAGNSEVDAIFWADVKDGTLEVGSYSSDFFDTEK